MKNCLALIGLVVVLILLVIGVFIFTGTYDLGELLIQGTPVVDLPSPIEPTPTLPIFIPTSIPTLVPEPTQIPDLVEYRTRVRLRARQFATALEAFWDTNDRAQQNPVLFDDVEWRSEIRTTLDELVNASEALSTVKPVPEEYQEIDAQLSQIGLIAAELEGNYVQGLETGEVRYFEAVDQNLNQIVEHVTQAQAFMIAAGWEP